MSSPSTTSHLASSLPEQQPDPARQGILFIVSAPSGAGKTTLCKQIVASISGVWHSISSTTRKPRPGEEHGREYFFIKEQVFHDMVRRDEFLEYAYVHDHWYGTPRGPLLDQIQQGVDVLLEIDVQGALQIKKQFVDAVSIFILPPSMEILRARLQNRASDSQEEILRRLCKVKDEVRCVGEYSYIIRNDEFERSLRELQSIFQAERLKSQRMDLQWLERNFTGECNVAPAG